MHIIFFGPSEPCRQNLSVHRLCYTSGCCDDGWIFRWQISLLLLPLQVAMKLNCTTLLCLVHILARPNVAMTNPFPAGRKRGSGGGGGGPLTRVFILLYRTTSTVCSFWWGVIVFSVGQVSVRDISTLILNRYWNNNQWMHIECLTIMSFICSLQSNPFQNPGWVPQALRMNTRQKNHSVLRKEQSVSQSVSQSDTFTFQTMACISSKGHGKK